MKILTRKPERTTLLEQSFIIQRRGMALLGGIFPFVFLISSFIFHRTSFQTSISAYYWTEHFERNFFVGTLCSISVFLILYKAYTTLEDRILDLAGVAASGVAFFPMSENGDCANAGISAHGVSAAIFFACIFYICIFTAKTSLQDLPPKRQHQFGIAYRWCAGIMIGSAVCAILVAMLPIDLVQSLCRASAVFWFEAVGVWSFSAFWYIKTRELDPSASWVPFGKK